MNDNNTNNINETATTDTPENLSSGLEKSCVINASRLSKTNYFRSLLSAAVDAGIISEGGAEHIGIECFNLLADITEKYTNGESSSVPVEIAEALFDSLTYTVSLKLKSYPTPDAAAVSLRDIPLRELYFGGLHRAELLVRHARKLYVCLLKEKPALDNIAFNATICGGISGFFKLYDTQFGSHLTHIVADYPLCLAVTELSGIEFITEYIRRLIFENRFCSLFPTDDINAVLRGQDISPRSIYKELIFNIYYQVLLHVLCFADAHPDRTPSVRCSSDDISRFYSEFACLNKASIKSRLASDFKIVVEHFKIDGVNQLAYLNDTLSELTDRLYFVVTHRALSGFISPIEPPRVELPIVKINTDDKMPDEEFRDLCDKVNDAGSFDEKLQIINSADLTYRDFTDLLCGALLEREDIFRIISARGINEAAALYKAFYIDAPPDFDYPTDGENKLRDALSDYIASLPRDVCAALEKMAGMISFYCEE